MSSSGSVSVLSADDIYSRLVERKDYGDNVPSSIDNVQLSRIPLQPNLVMHVSEQGTIWTDIRAVFDEFIIRLNLDDVRRGHIIVDGKWYPLEVECAQDVLQYVNQIGGSVGQVQLFSTFLSLKKIALSDGLVVDKTIDKNISLSSFLSEIDDRPRGIEGELYRYQLTGWRWLRFLFGEHAGGILADEMGLGKTLQVISLVSDGKGDFETPILIVVPGSILENWRREFAKFAPSVTVLKHHGQLRTGRPSELMKFDVILTSYDVVVRDSSLFNMILWDIVVLDEAQLIRNHSAQRTRVVKGLRRRSSFAITGTPIENRLLDVWSLTDFVLPGYLDEFSVFQKTFVEDNDGARLLEPVISPVILRRKLADHADELPPRIDIPQFVELDTHYAEQYESMRSSIMRQYGSAASLVALTKLRQFCAHPYLVSEHNSDVNPMDFVKFRRLDELIEEIFGLGEKVLVFTSFTAMADIVSNHITSRYGTFAKIIDGRTQVNERQSVIDEFSSLFGPAALILNPRAGGVGLNITAANHVIHYNPEWNPALEDQATARSHRRGQSLPVTVHRLLVSDTVEEVISERLVRKRSLSVSAIVGSPGENENYGDIVLALHRSPIRR